MRKTLLILSILISSLLTGCSQSEKCVWCGDYFSADHMAYITGDYYCPDCTVEIMNSCDFGFCDNCGVFIMNQDWLWELNGKPLCAECAYEEGRNSR